MKNDQIPVFALALEEAKIQHDPEIAEKLIRYLADRNMSLCTAESVTGGSIAKRLCAVPGASEVYMGGAVSYNTRLKLQWCGVSPKTIQTHGEVSAHTALEMATGTRKLCKTSVSISSTGFAGPATARTTLPVGTVFVGLDIQGKSKVCHLTLTGTRIEILDKAAQAALVFCYEHLSHT
jgi:nicotinamide-nucleotide amidase